MNGKDDIRALTYDMLDSSIKGLGEHSYRTGQLFDWLHVRKITSFDEMTNIPKTLRASLAEKYGISRAEAVKILKSTDGTRKYLCRLYDDNIIESVLLKYEHGNSACISSQVGCRMGCAFCASTVDGLVRSLSAGEMVSQIYAMEEDIGERINHVVVMGSGEPLDNFDELTRFYEIITDSRGAGLSGRNITVSTCGLVPQIRKLAGKKYPLTLALSLHAPTDEKRRQIMPVANSYTIAETVDALKDYFEKTGRRITIEYCVIEGFNDTDEDARGLSLIAADLAAHVNLIPVNPTDEGKYRAASRKTAQLLKNKLEKNRINVTIRREMGRDIQGACGQLRRRFIKDN